MDIQADGQQQKGQDKMCSRHVGGRTVRRLFLPGLLFLISTPCCPEKTSFCPFVELQAVQKQEHKQDTHPRALRCSFLAHTPLSLAYTQPHPHTGDVLSQRSQAGVELSSGPAEWGYGYSGTHEMMETNKMADH